jgi:hypothetical protein
MLAPANAFSLEGPMLKGLIVVTGLALAAGLAVPAMAADMPMKGKHHAKHMMSCYDYAWESQDQKDCLAKHGGEDMKPAAAKKMSKKKKAM